MQEDFSLNVEAFNDRLIAEAQESTDDVFKRWFDETTRDWPLDVAPMVGHALVRLWAETQPLISPAQFETVAAKCGFDDVLRHHDPVVIGDLRKTIEAHHDFDERNRKHHSQAPRERMWVWYVPAAFIFALLLTQLPRLADVQHTPASVTLRRPAADTPNMPTLNPVAILVREGAAMHRRADSLIAEKKPIEAEQALDAIIERFRDDTRGDLEEVLSLALYNKGWYLSTLGRDTEARAIYEDIWQRFWDTKHKDVRHHVAMSQVNLGHVYRRTGRHPDCVAAYTRVFSMFGDDADTRLRAQGAKSRFALAEYYSKVHRPDDARRLANSVVDKYENDPDQNAKHYVGMARALLVGLDSRR